MNKLFIVMNEDRPVLWTDDEQLANKMVDKMQKMKIYSWWYKSIDKLEAWNCE